MKPLAYPYFIIYNHFCRKSHSLQDYSARLLTMYLFSLSAGGWLLFLEAVNLRILKHYWFSSKEGASLFAALVYLLTSSIFHHIFIVKEKDRKIFEKYEGLWDQSRNKRRDLFISAFLIAIPYALLFSLSRFFPRGM